MSVFLAPQHRAVYVAKLDYHREAAIKAVPTLPGGVLTFGHQGGLRMTNETHANWLKHEAAVVFIETVLKGSSGLQAREQAEEFCRLANERFNARNEKYWSNQTFKETGFDGTWGLFYTLRDCHAAEPIHTGGIGA